MPLPSLGAVLPGFKSQLWVYQLSTPEQTVKLLAYPLLHGLRFHTSPGRATKSTTLWIRREEAESVSLIEAKTRQQWPNTFMCVCERERQTDRDKETETGGWGAGVGRIRERMGEEKERGERRKKRPSKEEGLYLQMKADNPNGI